MADKTVRLTHVNGATVVVSSEKAENLVNGGLFSKPQTRSSGSSTSK